MAKPKYIVRGAYGYDEAENSNASTHDTFDPSMTQQSMREDADINTIVKRFGLTGKLPDNIRLPEYGDYSEVPDFHAAQNIIAAATAEFNKLPAHIRSEFGNDPGIFHDACIDPANLPRLRELGLAKPAPEPETPARAAGPTTTTTPPDSLGKAQGGTPVVPQRTL